MNSERNIAERHLEAAARLRGDVDAMRFSRPADCVYNPLAYAWKPFEAYVKKFGDHRVRTIFLGMNPGPWGMAQTGVPFGEVAAVKNWLGIDEPVERPANEHPKRPVDGFACKRSEVSGRRLWGLFAGRFGAPENFFADHFVANYCPLLFIESEDTKSARNITPDKLAASERERLYAACDAFFALTVSLLAPRYVVGVGAFAEKRASIALAHDRRDVEIKKILHPSPASPISNAAPWGETATRELIQAGVWK